jgi:integrase
MPRKARKNESLRFVEKRGLWEAECYYPDPDDPTGQRELFKVFRAKDKAIAKERRNTFLANVAAGMKGELHATTVNDLATAWWESRVKYLAPKTQRSYRQHLANYILPAFGTLKPTALTYQKVQTWVNAYTDARDERDPDKPKYSKNTVAHMRDVLHNMLNYAKVAGYVTQNVTEGVKIHGAKPQPKRALTVGQAKAFLAYHRDHELYALWSVAIGLGMRQGEIIGLPWDAVDFKAGTINVKIQAQRVDGIVYFLPTKTAKGNRTLHLPKPLLDALKAHRIRQNEARLKAGEQWRDQGLVFPARTGKPLDPTSTTKRTQRALREAGQPVVDFHSLRHSAASILAALGLDKFQIRDLLGHTDLRTTDIYLHADEATGKEAAMLMAGLWQAEMPAIGADSAD